MAARTNPLHSWTVHEKGQWAEQPQWTQVPEVSMLRRFLHTAAMVVILAVVLEGGLSQAATVTNVFVEKFDGALNPLLTAWNGPTISGGIADLNGANGVNTAQGFTIDITSWNVNNDNGGPLVSWVMEAIVPDAVTVGNMDSLFAFNGMYGLRYRTEGGAHWEISAGTNGGGGVSKNVSVSPVNGDHVGLVYTRGPSTNDDSIAYYRNGVLDTMFLENGSGGVWGSSKTQQAGWGLEVHVGAYHARGFDGSLDAIAFSTFTGTFNGGSEFALLATQGDIPEPATMGLVVFGLAGLARYARRRR